jgi:stage II sporulation protein D
LGKKIRLFLIFISVLMLIHKAGAADTIKVLIVNDVYPQIPAKNEKIKKLGSMKGDLLVMGTHYSGNVDVWKGDNGLYFINELPIEDYVKDVVAVEVRPDWEMEALKAQAVISRTYAVYQKMMNGDSIYHIASSVLDQVYKGNNPDVRVAYAVAETSGEVLTFDNKPIEAFYHSTSCGRTENPEEVFGKSYPYLRSVESNCEISPYSAWEMRIQFAEIESALNLSGIKEISIKSYTSTNRVKQLEIIDNSGITTINATDFRKALGWSRLPSTDFHMSRDGDSIIFEGKGYGHGVGLSQWCTLQMARDGKNYKEILSFFYPGTTIKLYEGR